MARIWVLLLVHYLDDEQLGWMVLEQFLEFGNAVKSATEFLLFGVYSIYKVMIACIYVR